MRVTNNSLETISFMVEGKSKNGVPPMDYLRSGETKDIAVLKDDPVVAGYIKAGVISVPAAVAARIEAKSSS